jgi:curved DNA-binding protein
VETDLYKVLGVARDADVKTIKKAYYKIARESHPDLNPDDPQAEETFKAASVAFEVLGNEEKRKLYDEFGLEGLREGFDPDKARQYRQWSSGAGRRGAPGGFEYSSGPIDIEELFSNIFGGRSPFDIGGMRDFGGFPVKGRDVQAALELDFMTAVQGGERELRVGGRTMKVRIPSGTDDGTRLRLRGKGERSAAGADGPAGDLLLDISVRDHPVLTREGLDLFLPLPISFSEAIAGAKIDVPTPHGSYKVTIPSGVASGAKLRLKGKGVHRGKKQGNFYVVVEIHAPDFIDDELMEHAKALDRGYTGSIRSNIKL